MSWDAEDVEALQAELESYHAALFEAQKDAQKARAELEQARKELMLAIERAVDAEAEAQRYRDALERIAGGSVDCSHHHIARDALAGDKPDNRPAWERWPDGAPT